VPSVMTSEYAGGTIILAMAKRPTTNRNNRKPHKSASRVFRARFPNGTSIQRAYPDRICTHAYLVLYERPDAKDGFQRGFCASLDEAEAKVEAEMRWLSRHSHTFIEAFIVDVEDITDKIQNKKRRWHLEVTRTKQTFDHGRSTKSGMTAPHARVTPA
jgi:hypothetical protein